MPLRAGLYGTDTEIILALLTVGVCLVFAVACANVAGIMLARATTREREMALRMSLGAAGSQITRQLMVEGAVLSFLGAALGLVLAQMGLEFMRAVAFEQFYELVTIDGTVLAFSAALALVAPLLFGLAPALQLAGRELSTVLREAGAGAGTSGRVGRSRRGLVVMQIGLATALLIVSGLSVRTALVLRNYDFGFDSTDLLTARIDLSEARYAADHQVRAQADRILASLQALPNAPVIAFGSELPTFDRARQVAFKTRETPIDQSKIVTLTGATPGLFKALGMKLVRGRDFLETDNPQSPAVAVVNEALSAREFPGREPIGQRIQVGGSETPWVEIVGIASNLIDPGSAETPPPRVYVALAQRPQRSLVVFARTEQPEPILASLRETMRAIDPDQPIYDAKTMEQVIWEDLAGNRIITGLFMALGLVSLTLAAVGLYGLTAFLVAQRSREIGVRMALGASARDVVRMVISQGARLTAAGLALGVALGLLLGRAMASILIDVSPTDPITLVTTVGTLGLAAVLAHWVPARRAATVNPIDALRHD
jgi:putative ABC transport system permease protein